MKRIAILGSGATALAAAARIAQDSKKWEVTIIDFGADVHQFSNSSSAGSSIKSSVSGHLFELPKMFKSFSPSKTVLGSAAHGGWAEAWGGTMVPLSHDERVENGVTHDEFIAGEEKIRSILKGGFTTFQKEEIRLFPKVFARKLRVKSRYIEEVRASDLAIKAFDEDIEVACNQCGECLLGCPKNHIFRPSGVWPGIKSKGGFQTLSQVWIERVRESGSGLVVTVKESTNSVREIEFDYVFCGLGAIQTAALLVRSATAEKVIIKDSQLIVTPFIDPLLRSMGTKKTRISLSELFIFGKVPHIGGSLYSQLYGSSQTLTDTILIQSPLLKKLPAKLLSFLFSRIGIAMQFLDSDHSGYIEVTSESDTVKVISVKSQSSSFALRFCPGFVLFGLRLIPLSLIARIYRVGDGYHLGSSFPYGTSNAGNSSDIYGRPNGMRRLSIIDSSILSSVSSKPNMFNSMILSTIIVGRVLKSRITD
jgi:ferredoxin